MPLPFIRSSQSPSLPPPPPVPRDAAPPVPPMVNRDAEPMDLQDMDDLSPLGLQQGSHHATGHQVHDPSIDLDAYLSAYNGMAVIQRAEFVADHCPTLRHDALHIALKYIHDHTMNASAYQTLHTKLLFSPSPRQSGQGLDLVAGTESASGGVFDPAWAENTAKKAMLKTDKLDTDLKHYKSNSIKESIRRGQDDLGEHYLDTGDLQNALKCFSRSRDYCTTNRHIVQMCFNVIKVSAYLQNWSLVLSYVARAESTTEGVAASANNSDAKKDALRLQTLSRLRCASGLAELHERKYKQAARSFLQASLDHLDYPEIISHNNVATYGALCALATFDRDELRKNVMQNTQFRQFLELEPQLNDAIHKFYESKYAQCLSTLEEIKDNLLLDLYLAKHVEQLYSEIRNRGLVQYFSPFVSADMARMALAFNTSTTNLEEELSTLIYKGDINARIDSNAKILRAKDINQRKCTYEKIDALARAQEQRTKALILRAAVHRANIHVRPPSRHEQQLPPPIPAPSLPQSKVTPQHQPVADPGGRSITPSLSPGAVAAQMAVADGDDVAMEAVAEPAVPVGDI